MHRGCFNWEFVFLFFSFQKPYGCQLPGCKKRYTDPSSLRKHVKNHAIKDQPSSKRKNAKEPETVQKKLTSILKERSTDAAQAFNGKPCNIHIKEEPIFPMNPFDCESNENNRMEDQHTHSIDLMDISKCIMGIEEEKNLYNDYENMSYDHENSASDEYNNIEAIKKYLIEQPTEYIDLNSLQTVKHDCFNNF